MPKTKPKSKRKSKKGKAQPSTDKPPLSKKEEQAQKRQAARERQELFKVLTPAVLASAAIGLLLFAVKGPVLGIAGGGGLLVLALSFKYPRQALWFFMIYMPFSGTITYTVGKGNALFQLAKDGFYLPALISLVQQWKRQRLPFVVNKQLVTPLMILLTVSILTILLVNGSQQFAPACSSLPYGGRGMLCRDKMPIGVGILGLKVFMGYIPLISCGYYLIRSKKEFLFLTRLHVVLALICCGLGIVQYLFLLTGRCVGTRNLSGDDLFQATLEARCLIGGSLVFSPQVNMIRLPGTFVAPWQWAWFLISNTFFTFASAFSDPSLLWQIASFAGLASVFVNAVISGQRIALALVPVFVIILMVLTGQIANLKRFLPIAGGLGALGAIAMALFPQVIAERVQSFIDRWNASPPTEFIANQAEFTSGGQAGLLGKGLGRATNSARIFGNTALIETWFPKILYELGPIGLVAFLFFVTVLTVITFKVYRSIKDKSLRSYGACFWLFILFISYNTYYYPLDVDPVAIYYWIFAGVLLKLPELDRQEQEKLLEAELETLPAKRKKLR
jgi:hypothetical protein